MTPYRGQQLLPECWNICWRLFSLNVEMFYQCAGPSGMPNWVGAEGMGWLDKHQMKPFLEKKFDGAFPFWERSLMAIFPFWVIFLEAILWCKSLTDGMEVSFLGNWQVECRFPFWVIFWGAILWRKVWQVEWKFPFLEVTGGMLISIFGNFSRSNFNFWQVKWKFPFWEWLTGNFLFWKFFRGKNAKNIPKKEILWWETPKKGNILMGNVQKRKYFDGKFLKL